jgi:DNA polymerase-3 subunit chi
LTTGDENPNAAQVLFLTDGATSERVAEFEICAVLFDGTDEAAVTSARGLWRSYKDAGHEVTYWQQGESGGWDKQA